ncbi:MAG: aminoacyl-tRNA hydrolase [Microscillaceae bacterium]|jgi:PTH1 family peptidyl-tRNA hydrolase|nr:aminoacyl-tRNA hydrolase [Microscillaceae bacterium]
MKYLIVGLGNPGAEYELTRHNIGFLVLDQLADKHNATFQTARLGEKTEIKHKGRTLHLLKPNTYMNLSGKAVNYWLQELQIPKENLLVIVDDIALAHATLRMRSKGSSGGHNGLTNIEQVLGTQEYARLRFGVGNDYPKGKQADYVLSNFSQTQLDDLLTPINQACEMILAFATLGVDKVMSQYNQ